jgi:hypothetical protein
MSHLKRFQELKKQNNQEKVSFDCLLTDFEECYLNDNFFKLTICSKNEVLGNIIADNFCVLFEESNRKYWLSFDGATFGAFQNQIAIDFENLEIMIVYEE